MSKKIKFLLIGVFVISLFVSVFASGPIRIRFRKGAYGKNVSGYLNSYSAKKTYVLWARQGQTMKVRQLVGNSSTKLITFAIESPSGEDISDNDASCNNRKELVLPETGDYKINVAECVKVDQWRGKFRFNVTIK
jgi:hypothetical protein